MSHCFAYAKSLPTQNLHQRKNLQLCEIDSFTVVIFRKENYHNKLVYIQNEFIENQNGLNFNSNFEGGNLLKGMDYKLLNLWLLNQQC